ncbi:MAG: ABC transporter permease [Planctomycetota bacterium]
MSWFAVRQELHGRRRLLLTVCSFLIPLGLWCLVSYHPGIWHPLIRIQVAGDTQYRIDDRVPKEDFAAMQAKLRGAHPLLTPGATLPEPRGSLERANIRTLRQFADIAVTAGWVGPDQDRDDAALWAALRAWADGGLQDADGLIDEYNERILRHHHERIAAGTPTDAAEPVVPADVLLPPLLPTGVPANPVFLPAPHEVAGAFYKVFVTPPRRDGDPWLHERLGESLSVVVQAFLLACLIGIPIGLLCGTFDFFSRLSEPVVNFISYIPPPAFGALLVAIFGINDGPKIAMVFIAACFPMILMIAKTTRMVDRRLLEAAQVLGASKPRLVRRVILPGILPHIYNDLRILIALSWTILIIAEVTGTKSGISGYMDQQGRYRIYENVFAAMVMIGVIGMIIDQILAALHPVLFPWLGKPTDPRLRWVLRITGWVPSRLLALHTRHVSRYLAPVDGREDRDQHPAERLDHATATHSLPAEAASHRLQSAP